MKKDFKKTEPLDNNILSNNGIGWMLGGVAIGLVVGLTMYYFANIDLGNTNNVGHSPMQPQSINREAEATVTADVVDVSSSKSDSLDEQIERAIAEAEADKDNDRPGFSYYALLPALEVEVASRSTLAEPTKEKDTSKKKEEKKNVKVEELTRAGKYLLQIGSYQSEAQAKLFQKKMRSAGLPAYVQEGVAKGSTWYRVRLGPESNLNTLNKWRSALASRGIKPMQFRVSN